jgi:hypothetical protein
MRVMEWIARLIWDVRDKIFRMNFYSRHLIVEKVNGKLKLKLLKHEEFIERVEKLISRAKKRYITEKFIEIAMTESMHCNFVSFDCGHIGTFLQFWRGTGKVLFDYYMIPNNNLGNFLYPVLGVLAEMGFNKMKSEAKPIPYFFRLREVYGYRLMEANFNRDISLAVEFTCKVFKDIFKEDLNQIRARVG